MNDVHVVCTGRFVEECFTHGSSAASMHPHQIEAKKTAWKFSLALCFLELAVLATGPQPERQTDR